MHVKSSGLARGLANARPPGSATRQVQTNVDQVIAIIEARKQDVFDAVDNQAKKSLESLSKKKDEVENQVKLIESAVEQTKALVKRSFSTEILGFSETFDTILQEQGTQQNRDTEFIPRFFH